MKVTGLLLPSVSRPVSEIFRVLGFDVVFLSYADLPRALEALGVKG